MAAGPLARPEEGAAGELGLGEVLGDGLGGGKVDFAGAVFENCAIAVVYCTLPGGSLWVIYI